MSILPQTDIPSVAVHSDKKVLTVGEVADCWRVTDRHVVDLIEEGKLVAFDIAGRHDYVRVPMAAIKDISRRLNMTPEALLAIIKASKPKFVGTRRAFWRVPVLEGYHAFMRNNHSTRLAEFLNS